MDEEVPYLMEAGGVTIQNDKAPTQTQDEADVSTLFSVQKDFQTAMDNLNSFNAFVLLKKATNAERRDDLVLQIGINQGVYDILNPLLDTLNETVNKVKRSRGV